MYLGFFGLFGQLRAKTEISNLNSVYHIHPPKLVPLNSVSVYSVSVPVNSVRCSVFGFLCPPLPAMHSVVELEPPPAALRANLAVRDGTPREIMCQGSFP